MLEPAALADNTTAVATKIRSRQALAVTGRRRATAATCGTAPASRRTTDAGICGGQRHASWRMWSILRRTPSPRFAEIWIASLAPTHVVGYQFASRRYTASQVLGPGVPSLRRGYPRPVPPPEDRPPPPQGRRATAQDRRGMGTLDRQNSRSSNTTWTEIFDS
jgi:hypothetical protein